LNPLLYTLPRLLHSSLYTQGSGTANLGCLLRWSPTLTSSLRASANSAPLRYTLPFALKPKPLPDSSPTAPPVPPAPHTSAAALSTPAAPPDAPPPVGTDTAARSSPAPVP